MPDLLTVSNVAVSFGGLAALNGVSLAVEQGTIVGLIGPNGAGKTTLFNVVSGLQRALGSIVFDGQEIAGMGPHERARLGIGRSFQNLGLMREESVRTNVSAAQHLGSGYTAADLVLRPWRWWRNEQAIQRRTDEVLEALGLTEQADAAVADLSFGTARFVELAAVLVEHPRLMLLDEPTTGLDVAETERLRRLLVDVRAQGATVLVVAHDVRFVMDICDYVYVLASGRNLAEGPPAEMQRHPAVVEVYLGRPA